MENVLNTLFPHCISKKIILYIPKKVYECLYCGKIYDNKNIKFNDPNNCDCYYKWIYFHSSEI